MPRLKLFLLGAPRVELAGQMLTIERRKVKALLIFLAVTSRAHTRASLASLLWPEADHARAHGSLRRHLSELELLLGRGWIDANREDVVLRPDNDLWLDVAQFQQTIADCRQHGHGSQESCPSCIAPLTEAVALYQEDFLNGFALSGSPAFDEWAFFQAEALRRALTKGLQRLIQAHFRREEMELAIPFGQRWVQMEPLEEEAHRQLMSLYAHNRQPSAALRQYELCRHLLAGELEVAPASETTKLYEQILRGQKSQRGQRSQSPQRQSQLRPIQSTHPTYTGPRHNLPANTTPFIGRSQELADLRRLLLDPTVRLVTILGIGGMGKTRLALEAARAHLDAGQERINLVFLASLQSVDEVVTAIADAVGVAFQPDRRSLKEQLLDFLRETQLLLILDNLEHLPDAVGILHELLQAAPGVHILATSRERLQLSEEVVFALSGMAAPSGKMLEAALAYDTVRLFVLAAQRANPFFELTASQVPFVTALCRQVGGMPLAILLAAAWVDLLTPQEISREVEQSLSILQTKMRDVPERQRSIHAVFEHTWQRLGEEERSILLKLSIFQGGFTRAAAQHVAGATLPSLSTLVNKSLLQREGDGRYSLHELLRQFSAKELEAADAVASTSEQHSLYFATFLAEREADLKGLRQKAAVEEIEADFDNVRRAWQWASDHGQILQLAQSMESLSISYGWNGRFQEGAHAFAYAARQLMHAESDAGQLLLIDLLLIDLFLRQAHFCRQLGNSEQVLHLLQQSQRLLDNIDSSALVVFDPCSQRAAILKGMATLAYDSGDRQQASTLFAQSLSLYGQLGDRWQQAHVLLEMEGVYRNLHGLESAKAHQQQAEIAKKLVLESLTTFRELGDRANVASALLALGIAELTLGQPGEARYHLQEALTHCQELGSRDGSLADAMGYLGVAEEFLGNYRQMRLHGQALLAQAQATGYWHALRIGQLLNGCAALAEGDFVEAEAWLAKNVALLATQGQSASQAFALTGWGLACYWSGNRDAAQQKLVEALQIAMARGSIRPVVHGLLLAALLLAGQGKVEGAVELHALVLTYPFAANSRWCHDAAGRRLAALAEKLPPDVKAAAWQRGQARAVWQTAQEQLAWLPTK